MNDNDLIRRGDALYAIAGWDIPSTAIAALPAVTVGVKPLAWEGDGYWHSGDNEGWLEEANTPFGWGYAIEFGTTRQSPWVASSAFGETLTGFDDPDAAKAAAQADYEARILAALTPNPVDASQTPDPAVKALDDLARLGQEYDAAPAGPSESAVYARTGLPPVTVAAPVMAPLSDAEIASIMAEGPKGPPMLMPDLAAIREAALLEAAAACEYVIKNIDILKADGETYETPRVQKIARGLVDVARQDILAIIPKGAADDR